MDDRFAEVEKKVREQMGLKDSENEPSVLIPPESIYRTYKMTPFWRRIKRSLKYIVLLTMMYYLFFPIHQVVTLEGNLAAREMRVIDSKLNGEIVMINKSNGDYVKKGEVVFEIQNKSMQMEENRLLAEIEVLEKLQSAIKQNIENRDKIFQTVKKLYEGGDVSRLEFEREELNIKDLESQLSIKDSELKEKRIKLANLKAYLLWGRVESPFDGVIISPLEEKLHTFVREGDSLCKIASGGILFEFRVNQEAVESITVGQPLSITIEAYPEMFFEGRVAEINPVVHEYSPLPWIKTHNARILVSSIGRLPDSARLGMTAKSPLRLKRKKSRFQNWIKQVRERLKTN